MMKLRCTWCWKGRRERGMNRGRCRGRERRGRGERGREIHRGGERKVWSRGWERWRLQPRLSRHSTAMMKPWLLPLLSPLRYFIYLLIIIHTQKIIEIQGMIHRGNKMCRERVKMLMREREGVCLARTSGRWEIMEKLRVSQKESGRSSPILWAINCRTRPSLPGRRANKPKLQLN